MGKYDDDIYNELDKDNRLGRQNFRVEKVVPDIWPSGDRFWKISGVLLTADNADCSLTWTPPPNKDEIAAMIEKGALTNQLKGSYQMNRTIARQCEKYYDNRTPDELAPGDVLGVEVDYEKKGSRFIKIVAIHTPMDAAAAKAAGASDDPPPF